ncbi:HAD hydrolase family protein [Erysipelothrix sp. D19-032]
MVICGSVYTIGDSYNDLPMIKAFHGFAMDNGVDAVKKHAQNVVATVGDALKSVTE